MRIYKMTATFGKLEHATLELKPGLNIITAPNEWGKSTWCAFLVAMLYGLDTRSKSTKSALADKERYAPWSGSPMAGRIDLNWNGRDITIERSTSRRIPLGDFKAYETASGLPVEELNAMNCGQVLLGVEQSVFRRAGFIRQAELPVTQDEALRRRLNALVTTGDDSGAADRLADSLKELKNRCRYNRTGLLPQAEQERDALAATIAELDELEAKTQQKNQQLADVKLWLAELQNHRQALAYEQARKIAAQADKARQDREEAQKALEKTRSDCEGLPPRERAEANLSDLRVFREQWNALQAEQQAMPEMPVEPKQEGPFQGLSPEEAREAAREDGEEYVALTTGKTSVMLLVMGIVGLLAAGFLTLLKVYLFAGIAGAVSAAALGWGIWEKASAKKKAKALEEKYGGPNWRRWPDSILDYEEQLAVYREALREYNQMKEDLDVRLMTLQNRREALCADQEPDVVAAYWQQVMNRWDAFTAARRETQRTQSQYETINAMVRPVEKPKMPDQLTQSEEETVRLLAECTAEQQRLQNRLGQYQGRMAALGNREDLQRTLEQKKRRIAKLEDTYAALAAAQETLAEARAELQRRFAPRITRAAQKLLSAMTGGRYTNLTMGTDFSLQAGTRQEDVLRDAIWRSDGTLDQLYLALRLAVAQELTPNAPLILDDALVRFDDQRMGAAVELLRQMAQEKQIICFTCQNREKKLL